ncbi:MAG: succinate dehydrogenase/fumarate reductase iron-sulfur subunit [Terracidiphilus sp.]
MNKRIFIQRTDSNGKSHLQGFSLDCTPELTVLDALFAIQQQKDATLAFRCSCRVGMCGTCGIQINGVSRLACKTRLASLRGNTVFLAPLPHFKIIRDLAVSFATFFEQWLKVLPALRSRDPESTQLAVVPEDSAYARQTRGRRDCITCGLCFSSCGILAMSKQYLGPAAINRALLRVLDPRDTAHAERLAVLDSARDGVWRCHTQMNCTAVCPKGIDLTASIGQFKRSLLAGQGAAEL